MQEQHIIPTEIPQNEGIVVPLNLPDFRICAKEWREDGTICVVIVAKATEQRCPHCQQDCDNIHDRRPRCKRDLPSQSTHIELIVIKRRFHCDGCQKVFTEPDTACRWWRRTTVRLPEAIGEQAFRQPLSEVGQAFEWVLAVCKAALWYCKLN